MNKSLKIALTLIATIVLVLIALALLNCEKRTTSKKCEECEQLHENEMARYIGKIAPQPNGSMLFIEQKTGKTYQLIPCDSNCDNHLKKWFNKMGFVDVATKTPLLFDIEGQINSRNELLMKSAVLVGTEGE
ncbi:hypothetical protein [Elizabethkingia anophelis]|uniref:hypothetical protein n=1 Tax=Elizabethkingia anophelis TaxID=1117645 RepID=UPI00301B81A9